MNIEDPAFTLSLTESSPHTFERDRGGNEPFGNASFGEIEQELEQEIKQFEESIEKMLSFEESEIAQLTGQFTGQQSPWGFGTGMPYNKSPGANHEFQGQPQEPFGFGQGSRLVTPAPGPQIPNPVVFGSYSEKSPAKIDPTSSPNDTSAALVKGHYTDADLGKLPPSLETYREDILDAANKSGVPPNVLAAQIYQESRGKINAGSTNQATGLTDAGLMQVDPATFEALRKEHLDLGPNLGDPATNILAGAYYDEDMYKQFGSIPLMLRAYNSGPNGVDKGNANAIPAGVGDPNYVKLVMQYADDIQSGNPLPA